MTAIRIHNWHAEADSVDADIDTLAEVLHAVVYSGAGVSFVIPFSMDDARY